MRLHHRPSIVVRHPRARALALACRARDDNCVVVPPPLVHLYHVVGSSHPVDHLLVG